MEQGNEGSEGQAAYYRIERFDSGLASIKWTANQAALIWFFAVSFSNATGERYPSELWRLFGL